MNSKQDQRLPFSDWDNPDIAELRICVAKLREALSESIGPKRTTIDAAGLLNDTTDTALRYRCYLEEIDGEIRPPTHGVAK